MNLLEHYIKEIHEVIEPPDYPDLVVIDVTTNCYGHIERHKHTCTKAEWEKAKAKGYFMA